MNQRFYSLDVFRGATVALMILVNNPGSWGHIYSPLEHASWHGCTPTDLVFPFFLFAVGNAMAFVMPKLEAAGTNAFLKKVLTRTLLIFLIGLFLNWMPFVKWSDDSLVAKPFETVRILGVLQRIALCYCFASLIVYFLKTRGAFVASIVILLAYWLLCLLLGNPPDPYSMEGFWGKAFDTAILGQNHLLYKGEHIGFDPEGLASTLPAITQVIFGFFVGQYIQEKGRNFEMVTNLFVVAAVLIFAGYCWDLVFPINKKIWTSSYVLYTTGLAIMILAVMIYLIEFRQYKGVLTKFFDVFGKNPLFIFVLSGIIPRLQGLIRIPTMIDEKGKQLYTTPLGWFYQHICAPISENPKNGSLLYAIITILFYWMIVYFMDRKKIYIKV